MWRMLQQPGPDDYVIATGEAHSVRELCEVAFRCAGIELAWKGEGVAERGLDAKSGTILVEVDPKYFRPTEVDLLIGDAGKARRGLGRQPRATLTAGVEKRGGHDPED